MSLRSNLFLKEAASKRHGLIVDVRCIIGIEFCQSSEMKFPQNYQHFMKHKII